MLNLLGVHQMVFKGNINFQRIYYLLLLITFSNYACIARINSQLPPEGRFDEILWLYQRK